MAAPPPESQPTASFDGDADAITTNIYGDVQIPWFALPPDDAAAALLLRRCVSRAARGVWLTVPWHRLRDGAAGSPLHAALAEFRFTAHHATDGAAECAPAGGLLTLQSWRPSGPNPTPRFAHHACGAGAHDYLIY